MTSDIIYQIELTPLALGMLADIKDFRHLKLIEKRIEKLKIDPEKQGKSLTNPLISYRSIRAVGQRYRIIYQVQQDKILVLIVGVGLRKEGSRQDIYAILERLLGK
jgi:mRNA interferase RelE/StbE